MRSDLHPSSICFIINWLMTSVAEIQVTQRITARHNQICLPLQLKELF